MAGLQFALRVVPATAVLLLLLVPASGQECVDCHAAGKEAKAVTVPESGPHAELDCTDCHGELETPHAKPVAKVACVMCHGATKADLDRSSHGHKLADLLAKQQLTAPAAPCLACHGREPHDIRGKTDPQSPTNRQHVADTCLRCHESLPLVDAAAYRDSVHGIASANGNPKAAVCTDCHGVHGIDHFQLQNSKISREHIPATCGQCHPDEEAAYIQSSHWARARRGFDESPVCTDCHGEHRIKSRKDPDSRVWVGHITKTCESCHASDRISDKFGVPGDRAESFANSYHGLSGELGNLRAANCSSCHAYHMVLPARDPRSLVNKDRLASTCGRCHPGATTRFLQQPIHADPIQSTHWLVAFVRDLYLWLIVLTIGGMLVHNLADLVSKARGRAPYVRGEALHPRLSRNERFQHVVLFTSFLALVVSGFALKFPDSPFGWVFRVITPQSETVRRGVHQIAALAFVLLAVYHAIYLMGTRRGRAQVRLLLPAVRDVRDAARIVLGYVRKPSTPVQLAHYGYAEKLEYWAVVWGGIVMSVTGGLLYFINFTLGHFPLWVIDLLVVIHFFEAILATLAILVWHFYWVFFDPDVYPMNQTWARGFHPGHGCEGTDAGHEQEPSQA